MNPSHPIQQQIKNLLDEHGIQILNVYMPAINKVVLVTQDIASGQKATLELPFGKEI